MKHLLIIIARNLFTPITIAIFTLAAILLSLGEAKDAWFVSAVILFNTILACIQEIRAYLMLKKLELMSAPKARILRDGKEVEVMFDELQINDEIILKSGDEIPADVLILNAKSLEVNESMLTGESMPIKKVKNDKAWASTIVVAGSASAKVLAVKDETRAGKMTAKLKSYKPVLTPLQKKIANAISGLTFFALGLSVIIYLVYSFTGQNYITIFRTITTAAVVVVPEGLLLASSMLFAYGSIRLAQAKVLPQKLSAIEGMALLDVLATDKTGTLTSPEIIYNELEILTHHDENFVKELIWATTKETGADNSTGRAILAGLSECSPEKYEILDSLAFSSARKFAGIRVKLGRETESVLLGAPEFVLKNSDEKIKSPILERANLLNQQGLRTLILARFKTTNTIEDALKEKADLEPLALVTLKNELRPKVKETVEFLQNQNVALKVISGDNPMTVSFVAKEAGILNADSYITGEELNKLSPIDFRETVLKSTIFARVLPDQKERIIAVFQSESLYTGMVGDGVNDALAIKQSDLGIAMFDGAVATRRVADLVLLDNSFTALPTGMKIGNRIMQSIEMIAMLFFHKIILGVTLLFATLFLGVNYPFLPRHITFMNFILVTLPTFIVTFFPPKPRHRINPKHFWKDTLLSIAPIAFLSGITVTFTYWLSSVQSGVIFDGSNGFSKDVLTTTVIVASYFGALMTVISGVILDAGNTRNIMLGRAAYAVGVVLFTAAAFGISPLRDFFNFALPKEQSWFFIIFVVGLVSIVQLAIAKIMKDRIIARNSIRS